MENGKGREIGIFRRIGRINRYKSTKINFLFDQLNTDERERTMYR